MIIRTHKNNFDVRTGVNKAVCVKKKHEKSKKSFEPSKLLYSVEIQSTTDQTSGVRGSTCLAGSGLPAPPAVSRWLCWWQGVAITKEILTSKIGEIDYTGVVLLRTYPFYDM